MLLKIDLVCDVGCVRQNNEDMVLIGDKTYRDACEKDGFDLSENARFAAIIADGMGGHSGGEHASEMALLHFQDFIDNLDSGLLQEELIAQLKQWTEKTHCFVVNEHINKNKPEWDGMGTTFCGIFFYEKIIFSLNIGDSRLYRFRNGILKQISSDHSMRQLTGDNTLPSNQIYNSFGAGDSVFIDIKDLSDKLFEDDIFLICSDGLCDMITDEQIEQILEQNPTTENLVNQAKEAGGKDNISVVLLQVKEITCD